MGSLFVNKTLSKANSYIKKGKIDEAVSLCNEILHRFPANKRAREKLNFLTNQICSKVNDPSDTAISEIVELFNKKEYSRIIERVEKLTVEFPRSFFLWNVLGVAKAKLGYYSSAISAYDVAISLDQKDSTVYTNKGNSLQCLGHLEFAIEMYKKAISITPKSANSFKGLGDIFRRRGQLNEAIELYKEATSIKPDYLEAFYKLSKTFEDLQKYDLATENYQKITSLNPDHSIANHMINALTGKTTKAPPDHYVKQLFDSYATKFESSLVEDLNYDLPKKFAEIIKSTKPNKPVNSILDLGCGTGLMGREARSFCKKLVGIDLSGEMLKQAKNKGIYDQLIETDILKYLSEEKLNYDYFIAADVFIYIGDLSDVFRLIKSKNNRSGRLMFSTEHLEGRGFFLEKSGRFSHSRGYVEELCEKFDYRLSYFSLNALRKDKDDVIMAGLYLLEF